MSTVQDRITNIVRVDINDEIQSRFTDQQLLTFFKQAIRRAQGLGVGKQLAFARKTIDFNMISPNVEYQLPNDFISQIGVWRTDTKKPILNTTLNEWELAQNPKEFSLYNIDVGQVSTINFLSGSTSDIPIRIRYWYDVLPDSLTLSSQMPWHGKLDYVICEYVNLRAFHVDRYDLSADMMLLKDMEKAITDMYIQIEPLIGQAAGAFY